MERFGMWFVPLPGPRAPEMGGFGNGMCAPLVLGASRFGAAVGRRERHNIFGKKKKNLLTASKLGRKG